MGTHEVKPGGRLPTRRDILRAAAATAGLVGLGRTAHAQVSTAPAGSQSTSQPSSGPASQPTTRAAVEPPWWLVEDRPARVVDVRSASVLRGLEVNEPLLSDLIEKALRVLVEAPDGSSAWKRLLGDATRIAIKFNQVGAETIGTSPAMARALVRSLAQAGYGAGQIALLEVPDCLQRELGSAPAAAGWGAAIPVGDDDEDEIAAWLYEADALINIPFLKTHPIAGMSGAMKNVSHAVLRHPARYHGNGCAPFVGRVVGNPAVSRRLRVTIMDALRVVVRNGPEANPEDVISGNRLIIGCDPVAVDRAGYRALVEHRRDAGLLELPDVRYLGAAAGEGVGIGSDHAIQRLPLEEF